MIISEVGRPHDAALRVGVYMRIIEASGVIAFNGYKKIDVRSFENLRRAKDPNKYLNSHLEISEVVWLTFVILLTF